MLARISITKRLGKEPAQQEPQNIVACVAEPQKDYVMFFM